MVTLSVACPLNRTVSFRSHTCTGSHQLWRAALQHLCHTFKEFPSVAFCLECSFLWGYGLSQKPSTSLPLNCASIVSYWYHSKNIFLVPHSQWEHRSWASTLFLAIARTMSTAHWYNRTMNQIGLSAAWDQDITMASGAVSYSDQYGTRKQHGPQTWLQAVAQTLNFCMGFGGNLDHGHKHWPWLKQGLGPRHDPQWQEKPAHYHSPRWHHRPLT